MLLSMREETAENLCELSHPTLLEMALHRKELNTTKVDWFLTHSIFTLAKF